ncbi:MAG: MarR family winged helix-turn-helix transcriptional regulator [Pseudomonadota bacterium]
MNNHENIFMNFFKEIFTLEQLARNRMERALPSDMKISHFTTLSYLVKRDTPSSPAELASAFQVTRPTMTNTLQKLEARNYIQVSADAADGRGKLIIITQEGRNAFFTAVQALSEMFGDVANTIGEEPFKEALIPLTQIRTFMDSYR